MDSRSAMRCIAILLLSASYCFAWSFYGREDISVDCIVGKWRRWSQCMLDFTDPFHFDVMTRNRYRPVIQWPRGRGKTCPPLQEIEECSNDSPLDCEVGDWSHWSYCSHESNAWNSRTTEERFREVLVEAKHGGEVCPEVTQVRDCELMNVDVDCQVSEWSGFSECFTLAVPDDDDLQVRERVRMVEVDPQGQGEECPVLTETELCEEPAEKSKQESPKKPVNKKKQGCRGSSGCSSSKSESPKRRRGGSSSSSSSSGGNRYYRRRNGGSSKK